MKQSASFSGCLWPLAFGAAGVVTGMLVGWLGEYFDITGTFEFPGVMIAASMIVGGIIGVAVGMIVFELMRLRRIKAA